MVWFLGSFLPRIPLGQRLKPSAEASNGRFPRRGPTLRPPTSEPPRWLLLRRPLAHGSGVEEEAISRDRADWGWTARDANCCHPRLGMTCTLKMNSKRETRKNQQFVRQRRSHSEADDPPGAAIFAPFLTYKAMLNSTHRHYFVTTSFTTLAFWAKLGSLEVSHITS